MVGRKKASPEGQSAPPVPQYFAMHTRDRHNVRAIELGHVWKRAPPIEAVAVGRVGLKVLAVCLLRTSTYGMGRSVAPFLSFKQTIHNPYMTP
jgi:hypothetical protein